MTTAETQIRLVSFAISADGEIANIPTLEPGMEVPTGGWPHLDEAGQVWFRWISATKWAADGRPINRYSLDPGDRDGNLLICRHLPDRHPVGKLTALKKARRVSASRWTIN